MTTNALVAVAVFIGLLSLIAWLDAGPRRKQ